MWRGRRDGRQPASEMVLAESRLGERDEGEKFGAYRGREMCRDGGLVRDVVVYKNVQTTMIDE